MKAQGVYENTLIAFIGDNGYFHGDRGLADKWYPYEQALRVPLIVRDPRVTARARGVTRDQLALNIDVAPTIVAAAGMPVPDVMQGRDLGPLYLTGKAPTWRDEFFFQHPTITFAGSHPLLAGRDPPRLEIHVYFPEFDFEQLFNLKADAEEIRNLAQDPAHAGQRAKMRQKLEEWRGRAR